MSTRTLTDDNINRLKERLAAKLQEYAEGRADDVSRGLETPALAGLLVQKYGYGMAAAAQVFDDVFETHFRSGIDFDAATASVDPDWRENMHKRWSAKADVDLSQPRPVAKSRE